ncbi:hypothetical protein LEP1GSC058_1601 [Leptospira fainei serovar Hurstbridge str. BUT 6]|uniref:Uncharacterized protein n=1 Tax=Leptospira fainei serovar Hurstbridge str. BUT 6 TaxID=1193011 RepID=S3V0C5_9LEPT|nr:hypothetical protein LEP1GSC058_1601 [Leptospira fainei serovar Hurstbridge str. BUT 6]
MEKPLYLISYLSESGEKIRPIGYNLFDFQKAILEIKKLCSGNHKLDRRKFYLEEIGQEESEIE